MEKKHVYFGVRLVRWGQLPGTQCGVVVKVDGKPPSVTSTLTEFMTGRIPQRVVDVAMFSVASAIFSVFTTSSWFDVSGENVEHFCVWCAI